MNFKNGIDFDGISYGLTDILLFVIFISFILSITLNIKMSINETNINKLIFDLNDYTNSIKNFKIKYGFLPGDLKKTQILDLSKNNSDGNGNDLIEDRNQIAKIYNKSLEFNGEVYNFWIHLYNSRFLKNNDRELYQQIGFLNTGIIVFTHNDKNYFNLSVQEAKRGKKIKLINNFTPYNAYLIDRKFDDELPFSGNVLAYGGDYINDNNIVNKHCADEQEYLTFFKEKFCQLIMKLNVD
jgi:hypothetical protein